MCPASRLPQLPSAYDLQILGEVDSVLGEAARRARAGADEGTLIWARSQRDARSRRGRRWHAPAGNLHCALVLRPEFDNLVAQQLCAVSSVAAGAALAEVLAPMTGMGFAWPGDLLINELLAGAVQLAGPGGARDPWPWLAIGLTVNIAYHPPNPEPERFNSVHASGDAGHVGPERVLEQFARHFLRWINRWAEDGFEPVRKAWSQRALDRGRERCLHIDGRALTGIVRGIGDHGELILDTGSERPTLVRIDDYFGLGTES